MNQQILGVSEFGPSQTHGENGPLKGVINPKIHPFWPFGQKGGFWHPNPPNLGKKWFGHVLVMCFHHQNHLEAFCDGFGQNQIFDRFDCFDRH